MGVFDWVYNSVFGKQNDRTVVHKYIYNYKRQKVDERDLFFHLEVPELYGNLPTKVDLRETGFMPPVLDQGRIGSCVANAASNALQYCLKKEKETEFSPSRLYIYYYTRFMEGNPTEDTGCVIRDAMKEVHTYGVCKEKTWPYDISKFAIRPSNACTREAMLHTGSKYLSVRQNLNSIKQVLARGLPIVFGVDVYESFQSEHSMRTGEIPLPDPNKEELLGGHCLLICGLDDDKKVFYLQNSWGTSVGIDGYFTIPYDYVLDRNLASDFWVITYWK